MGVTPRLGEEYVATEGGPLGKSGQIESKNYTEPAVTTELAQPVTDELVPVATTELAPVVTKVVTEPAATTQCENKSHCYIVISVLFAVALLPIIFGIIGSNRATKMPSVSIVMYHAQVIPAF